MLKRKIRNLSQDCLLPLFCLLLGYGLFAQELYIPRNIQQAIDEETRTTEGIPGVNYWQNEATYDIEVALDPVSGTVRGSEEVTYKNNSPDSLKQLVIALYSDIFNKTNKRDFGIPPNALNDGVQIHKLVVDGVEMNLNSRSLSRSGTNMTLTPKYPVLPGKTVQIEIDWQFSYPKGVTIRNGDYRDSTFFVSYFYPKIAVYDDISGWDRINYTGQVEFYADYADYEVEISVPSDFVVWATGILQNPEEVLNAPFLARYKQAQSSYQTVQIIKEDEAGKGEITKNKDLNIFKFSAENVPDFAFGTSDKFCWDARRAKIDEQGNGSAMVHAAYRIDSEDYREVADIAAQALYNYSTQLPGIPYPYPQMTVFNGNSGMEFPMMCNDVSQKDPMGTIVLTYHEIAHSWFPFLVGINERKYAFMDEGWANLFPTFYLEKYEQQYFESRKQRYYRFAGEEYEQTMMTPSNLLSMRNAYRQNSYNKSYFAYYYLIELMGEKQFQQVLQEYISIWAGKHPSPYDFYNIFNELSKEDLNWYWNSWFFERGYADLEIKGIHENQIVLENPGGLPLPIQLELTYDDQSREKIMHTAEVWNDKGNLKGSNCGIKSQLLIPLKEGKVLYKAVLGNDRIIDVNEENNSWKK
jgi:hypothetical protein